VAATPALADGTYVAYATQDDSNANTSYSAPRTFTVDATQPGVSAKVGWSASAGSSFQ